METIYIKQSKNADTRTATGVVTKQDLLQNSVSHIEDVEAISAEFAKDLMNRTEIHDYTKIQDIDQFHSDFEKAQKGELNFIDGKWFKNHITKERHHLESYVHEDVDMLDVLEMIFDCVAAGMARSGEIREINISSEVLQRAVNNTAKKIADNIVVEEN